MKHNMRHFSSIAIFLFILVLLIASFDVFIGILSLVLWIIILQSLNSVKQWTINKTLEEET